MRQKIITAVVWIARIVVGAAFIVAGFAKCIDPQGFVYKIEDYLHAWNFTALPTLEVVAAFGLSMAEFAMGVMLIAGCYRRTVTWLLGATMGFMLPLTAYIMVADPVSDCGCFGDMFVISNTATFLKNVVLTLLVVLLILWNRRAVCLIKPSFQWIGLVLTLAYGAVIAYIGFSFQPLIDFRPYPVGISLVAADSSDDDSSYLFTYTRDGVTRDFPIDSLPDDSWEFVDRKLAEGNDENAVSFEMFNEAGDEVSDMVISPEGEQLLVLIPNAGKLGYSRAHLIRGFADVMNRTGGALSVVIAGDNNNLWREHIGHNLEVYTSEDTKIKEVARGEIALVFLKDGVIQWKLNAVSLPTDYLDTSLVRKDNPMGRLAMNSGKWLWSLTLIYLCAMVVLSLLPWIVSELLKRSNAEEKGES